MRASSARSSAISAADGLLIKESAINFDVGVDRLVNLGERVEKAGTLCRVHATSEEQAKTALVRLKTAITITAKQPKLTPLVMEIISR